MLTMRVPPPADPSPLLNAPHWQRLVDVSWPGRPGRRIDEVVIGPSGVHVILHRLDQHSVHHDDALELADVRAAAAAVGWTLPERYRAVVHAALRLGGADEARLVDGVTVASPARLAEAIRFRPRLLSTSEATAVADRLSATLAVWGLRDDAVASRGWRSRLRRRWRTAATRRLS